MPKRKKTVKIEPIESCGIYLHEMVIAPGIGRPLKVIEIGFHSVKLSDGKWHDPRPMSVVYPCPRFPGAWRTMSQLISMGEFPASPRMTIG